MNTIQATPSNVTTRIANSTQAGKEVPMLYTRFSKSPKSNKFSLKCYQNRRWQTGSIIAPLVIACNLFFIGIAIPNSVYKSASKYFQQALKATERNPVAALLVVTVGGTLVAIVAVAESVSKRAGKLSGDGKAPDLRFPNFDLPLGMTGDIVECSVYSPSVISQQMPIVVQVFAHLAEMTETVSEIAASADSSAAIRGITSLATRVTNGDVLAFHLMLPNCDVDDPFQSVIWNGERTATQFVVHLRTTLCPVILGKLVVLRSGIPIGNIHFQLKAVEATDIAQDNESEQRGTATQFRKAFVSYAAEDREEVFRRVQMLSLVGIEYFQDVISLSPGDLWEKKLDEWISATDVMFLFWSQHAERSEWVKKEYSFALERKGSHYIVPVVIEGPPFPPPPSELSHLHFADRHAYFIAGIHRSHQGVTADDTIALKSN